MTAYAIVLAGGSGSRMGAEENKVLLPILGVPALVRAIAPFTSLVKGVIVVARREDEAEIRGLLFSYGLGKAVTAIVRGGDTRQESVLSGLRALPDDCDTVLVHDGARPLITERVIKDVIASVSERGSGVAAIQATDTIKLAGESGAVISTPPRESLYHVQTPQGFTRDKLVLAHEKALIDGFIGTDDAALVERLEEPIYLCAGDEENIKLTRPVDLVLAKGILQAREDRT